MKRFGILALTLWGLLPASEFPINKYDLKIEEEEHFERVYEAPLTEREKEDIAYIVNTLGMESLSKGEQEQIGY